jgi:hypothetical protein
MVVVGRSTCRQGVCYIVILFMNDNDIMSTNRHLVTLLALFVTLLLRLSWCDRWPLDAVRLQRHQHRSRLYVMSL